jgi:fibronectin-binding autotransporter adhesin
MRHFYQISLFILCCLFYGFTPARSENWSWTGEAGTTGWYDVLQIGFPPNPDNYINNWSRTGNPPSFPADTADVLLDDCDVVLNNNNAHINSLSLEGSLGIEAGKHLTISSTFQNDGIVTINSNNGATNTYLLFESSITLEGAGQLRLNQSGAFAELKTDTDVTLTQDGTHSICGSGRISAALINNGLIDADSNGKTLELMSNSISNCGTMQASSGGILSFQIAISYDNTGGSLAALDASRVELNEGMTISGGILSTTGSGVIRSLSAYNSATPVTLIDLSNDGAIEVYNNKSLRLTGTITNTGTILVNSTGSGTYLKINGDVTLTGNGALQLSYSTGLDTNHVLGTGSNRLINDTDHTIRGSGGLGENTLEFTNQGTIQADQARALDIDPYSELINSGAIKAVNGATLYLYNGNYANNSGSISALDASLVVLYDSVNITGGTLSTAGSGIIRSLTSSTSANPATLTDLTNTGTIEVYNNKSLRLSGTINNTGTILVNSTGSATNLRISGDVTIAGTGLIRLSDPLGSYSNQVLGTGNNRLTNQASHSIKGSGSLGTNNLALTNYGLIEADRARVLEIDPANSPADGLSSFINYGTVRASASGGLNIYGSTFSNPGTLEATSGSTLVCYVAPLQHSGATLTGGTWIARENSTLNLTTGSNITTNQGTVILDGLGSTFAKINTLTDNQGNFQVLGGRSFTTVGDLANSGSLLVDGGGTFNVTGDLTGMGNTTVSGSSILNADSLVQSTLTIGSGGKVVIASLVSGPLAAGETLSTVPEPHTLIMIIAALATIISLRFLSLSIFRRR